jgi:uncharacterized protein
VIEGKNEAAEKYADYFDYSESINTIPSHRALAVLRGRREEMLDVQLRLDCEAEKPTWSSPHNPCEMRIAARFNIKDMSRPADRWLMDTARWTWRVKSFMHLETELMGALRSKAETEAINVFARNLKALLLAAPAGPRVTMGLDPGIRTGVKVAVVDETGKVVNTAVIYPHQPRNDWDGSLHTLAQLAKKHRVTLIAIGNGTASRETDKLAQDLIKLCGSADGTSAVPDTSTLNPNNPIEPNPLQLPLVRGRAEPAPPLTAERSPQRGGVPLAGARGGREGFRSNEQSGLKMTSIVVSEAGASVYSASEFASKELPDMDVSLRGAVSIARRLQDPLAELVKIDPKSIGVGQYQHDVSQFQLARSLDAVVEDCVNAVGVDVNTASVPLLARVSGLSSSVAQAIVTLRDSKGKFTSRAQLREVPRLGDKTFEQAAGFLRIMDGNDPLDASAVHPESYPLVQRILADIKQDIKAVIGNSGLLKSLSPTKYMDEKFGIPTISDILKELEKPGRDPRPEFTTATFKEGVESLSDLQPDMILEGVVTNVAAFGAFVDIGVHQDGLVHISALSNTFVKDPHKVVRVGQVVKVKVLEVDEKRKRIALTMRLTDTAAQVGAKSEVVQREPRGQGKPAGGKPNRTPTPAPMGGAIALAFQKLKA